jgi:superoxide reductase
MAKKHQIYKCDACGNIIEVLHGGDGELVCCGEAMKLFDEKSVDEGKEKHVPVIEPSGDGIKVKVGSNPHPMEEKHHIEWIEITEGDTICKKFLKPGDDPEALFRAVGAGVSAREYCNVHGLWKS